MKRIIVRAVAILLVLGGIAGAAGSLFSQDHPTHERSKSLFRVVRLNESVVGISCPGNGGDPTVVTNLNGTLLVSCGTK